MTQLNNTDCPPITMTEVNYTIKSIKPKAPALLAAEANRQPEFQIMPAWIMGYCILKSCVILLAIIF